MSNKEAIEKMIDIRNSLEGLRDTVINYEEICIGKRNRIICGAHDILCDTEKYNFAFHVLLRNWKDYIGKDLIDKLNHIHIQLCMLSTDLAGSRKFTKRHLKWLRDIVRDSDTYKTFDEIKAFIKNTQIYKDKSETERLNEVWRKTKLDLDAIAISNYPSEVMLQMVYEKWNENYSLLYGEYIKPKPLEEHFKDMEE